MKKHIKFFSDYSFEVLQTKVNIFLDTVADHNPDITPVISFNVKTDGFTVVMIVYYE